MSVRERCSCGARFEVEGDLKASLRAVSAWRRRHTCPDRPEVVELTFTDASADVQLAPDYTVPEMHIGFRHTFTDDEE